MTGVWNIHKNSVSVFFQFKRFRVSGKFNRTDVLAVGRIDDAEPSLVKTDINLFGGAVIAHIVGIIFQIEFADLLERFSVVRFANAGFVIRDEDAVQFRKVGDPLRCTEASNRVNSFALAHIENFDGVVAKRADKQSFASGVKGEMVDPSFDTW